MKRAILQITDHLLIEFFKAFQEQDGQWRVHRMLKNTLPDDAKPIRCSIMDKGVLGILIESESFREIPEAEPYPILDCPVFEVKVEDGNVAEVEYK